MSDCTGLILTADTSVQVWKIFHQEEILWRCNENACEEESKKGRKVSAKESNSDISI